jgi:hypothetical protein
MMCSLRGHYTIRAAAGKGNMAGRGGFDFSVEKQITIGYNIGRNLSLMDEKNGEQGDSITNAAG